MAGISISLPISRNNNDGFSLLKNYDQVAAQNLRMLVLTSPGERMMDPDFGVGARRFLFEQMTQETFERFRSRLLEQQRKYMPYLRIEDIQFSSPLSNPDLDENRLEVKISYFNTILRTSNVLLLPIS